MINAKWSLSLDAPTAKLTSTASDAEFGGTTTGTGGTAGEWAGQFYGAPVTTGDGDNVTADDYPSSVVGEFTGHFEDGHVIGAFGATTE